MTQVNSQVELRKFSDVIRELFEEYSELLMDLDAPQHEKLMDLFVTVGIEHLTFHVAIFLLMVVVGST